MPSHIAGRLIHHARTGSARRAARGLAAAVAAGVLACAGVACSGDSTAPTTPATPSLTVTVSVDQFHGPVLRYPQDSEPVIECATDVRATAAGSGQATWLGASVQLFGGFDKADLLGTLNLKASDVQSAWGKPEITVGDSQRSTLIIDATEPFKAVVRFSYQLAPGSQQMAELDIDCGPTVPAGTPAPSVTVLAVHADTGAFEPTDTLSIDYTASSPVGLWETVLTLSGPCDVQRVLPDSLKKSVTRTVRLAVPSACSLGVPITVTVAPKDVALQTSARTLATDLRLVDETPPRISPIFFPPSGCCGTTALSGIFFGDDSIHELFNASDNAGLSAVVWEFLPAGVKDSLLVTGLSTLHETGISIPPGVTGPIQLRVFARDAAGLTSDMITVGQDGGAVVYPALERPTRSATVSGEIRDVAIDTRRGLVYLLQSNQARLAVLSLASMTITQTATMPFGPSHMDLTPSGDTLVVLFPSAGALGIIDLRQSSPQPTIVPLAGYDAAAVHVTAPVAPDMSVAANGKVFVSLPSSTPAACTLLEVDLATGEQHIRTDAGNGGIIGGGAMSGSLDHSVVVLTGGATYFQRYDAGTDSFGPRESATSGVGEVSVDATGSRLGIGLSVYDESLHFLRTVDSPVGPGGVPVTAVSAAGDVVYQILWPGIVRSRVDDGVLLDRIPNPIRPDYLRASADGTLLVTVESEFGATSKVSVIELQ